MPAGIPPSSRQISGMERVRSAIRLWAYRSFSRVMTRGRPPFRPRAPAAFSPSRTRWRMTSWPQNQADRTLGPSAPSLANRAQRIRHSCRRFPRPIFCVHRLDSIRKSASSMAIHRERFGHFTGFPGPFTRSRQPRCASGTDLPATDLHQWNRRPLSAGDHFSALAFTSRRKSRTFHNQACCPSV